MHFHNLQWLKPRRRELRRSLTPAEAQLWKYLQKGSRLDGRKFRRQHGAGQYVLDFYCPSEKLAIEIDGTVHDTDLAQRHDWLRDRFLSERGIRVPEISKQRCYGKPQEGVIGNTQTLPNHPLNPLLGERRGRATTPAFSHPS